MSLPDLSVLTERQMSDIGRQDTRQGLPPPPRAAWMWKPRSKLVDSDGNARHTTSLLQLRRLGAKHWNRRFVFLDHHLFCYGKDKGRKDKQVPFELIEAVRRETAEKLRREHAPKEFAGFGWYLAVKGRTLLFCAESEESAAQWVDYLAALLRAMKGSPTGPLPGTTANPAAVAGTNAAAAAAVLTPETQTPTRGATLAEIGARYDEAHPHDETHYGTLTTLTSPGELLTEDASMLTPAEQPRPASPPAAVAATESLPQARPSAVAQKKTQGRQAGGDNKSSGNDNGDNAEADRRSTTLPNSSSISRAASRNHGEQQQQQQQSDDDAASDRDADGTPGRMLSDTSVLDVSSDDTEGVDSGEEGEGGADGGSDVRAGGAAARHPSLSRSATAIDEADAAPQDGEGTERKLPAEVRYARFLLPLAADPHSHIDYRIPALESHFKSGDDISGVTFSRTMEKIGKRDNAQTREVVLTTRHLYLFSKGGLANSQQVRCIDTHDITGVVESTSDKAVVAVLIPTFHDILLKVVPQNSCVPGTPAEVKQQLIAHLYKAHCDMNTDHRFLFRESAAVAKEIRRTEDAKYPPLIMHPGDQMRVGEKAGLLETFAKNADEAVFWSSMVRQVQADRKPRLCALVVTEGSLYSLSDTLQAVVRRTFLRDLLHVEYDRDAQSILLQCRGVDVLFNMQSSAEFDDFLRVLPAAVAVGFGRTLRLTPSKQLYSHAKLFTLSTLNSAGPAGAARAAGRRHRGFLWSKGKKAGGGTRLLSSFAAAADGDDVADDEDGAYARGDGTGDVAEAFHHSIQGDYRNSQAIRLFCAQFRFVEEVLLDYDDAVGLWQQYEMNAGQPKWDALRLRSTFTTRVRVGEICLSAACRLLDAKECTTLAKASALDLHESVVKGMGTPRAICVTSEGFLFLRNGVASAAVATSSAGATGSVPGDGSGAIGAGEGLGGGVATVRSKVKSRLSVAVSHISSSNSGSGAAGKDDDLILELIGWSSIAAVVRCHSKEGSSVALLTNRTHPVDYLFHLDTAQTMLDVMAAAMGSYADYRHGDLDHTHLLPLYAAPRVQNLAVALKKTVFDPFPTVALRYTPYSFPSDRLRMAFIPDVADACRRFGDNTIYFSGVAWRVRSATLRKYGGHLDDDPGAGMRRQNNHLYKSYIFVLTNAAIYHCTKGGFEVVRRTLLTDITGITVGLHDPDTVLLSVPSEYDMYFRVGGRGAEVVARLQEAYVEWTNYGHYLPYERQGCHSLADYGLPVRQAACVAALGTLTKPAYFNDLQSSRPAAECRHQTQQWHLRCLRRAIASFERAQAAARKERRPATTQWSTWARMRAALAERQSYLYFVQRRCFRFGLTSEEFDEMQRAQRLLRSYREMEASATALIAATSSTDSVVFKEALQRAAAVPDLRLLVEEENRIYEGYLARRGCLTAVVAAVQRYRYRASGSSTSLVELEATLLDLLHVARRVGFDAAFLRYMVHVVRVLVQRTQIQRVVSDPANQPWLSTMADGGWVLVQQVAGEVGMTWRPPAEATAPRSSLGQLQLNVRVAQLALRRCALTGEPALLHGAAALALSVLDACDKMKVAAGAISPDSAEATTLRTHEAAVLKLRRAVAVVQDANTPAKLEERQHLTRAVEALIAARQTHQRQQTWTPRIVSEMLARCVELEAQLSTQPALLALHRGTQSVFAMEHAMLMEQQHRLQLRHALARKELKAQQQHERELQQRQLATQRAAVRRQRREATALERRQRRALTLWGGQVDQLVTKLDAALANAAAEADESIRLGIKRCVHLQRWIAEAGARYGLAATRTTASSPHTSPTLHRGTQPASSPVFSPLTFAAVDGERALADLVAKLQSVAARAQRLLDQRARGGGADPYARSTALAPSPSKLDAAEPGGWASGSNGAESGPPTLPAEVEQLIARLDTDGLVAYIQQLQQDRRTHHSSTGTPNGDDVAMTSLVDAIRLRWRRARRHQRWVAALHRRLHAAAVLHSRELLEAALQEADAAHHTDAAVETARRAVAVMQHQGTAKRKFKATDEDGGGPSGLTSTASVSVPTYVDPWRRQPVTPASVDREDKDSDNGGDGIGRSRDGTDNGTTAPVLPVLRAAEEAAAAEVPLRETGEAETCTGHAGEEDTTDNSPKTESATAPILNEVETAMEEVVQAAEALPPTMLTAKAALRHLYAATLALVHHALASAETTAVAATTASVDEANGAPDAAEDAMGSIDIEAGNPFCAPFLQAWQAVLQHHVRPSGLLIKSPRGVWDLVRGIGEANTDGAYAAPYVTRLSSDFRRLYRSNDDSDAGRQRTDAVLLALVFFSHRMSCVWDGVVQLGEEGRRELLLPDSLMAQPAVVRALLSAARVCDDKLQWRFANVQTLAMECLFPRDGTVEVPIPPRLLNAVQSSNHNGSVNDAASAAAGTPRLLDRKQAATSVVQSASLPGNVVRPQPRPPLSPPPSSSASSRPRTPPHRGAVSPSALDVGHGGQARTNDTAMTVAEVRDAASAETLCRLQEAVRDIASYFTHQLRLHGPAPGPSQTSAAFFDEHRYPEVGSLVDSSVLPALVSLLSCGLVRRYQLVRTRTLWDVLTTLKAALIASSRTLAAGQVLPIMDLVAALTDVENGRGRYSVQLRTLSDEQLGELRVRVFLRECLSRRQLYPLMCALFPPLSGNETWVADGSGELWTLYSPELCLLYPPDAPSSAQLRPLLERLSSLPFVLIPDRELQ